MAKSSPLLEAVRQFCSTTTLHGFKYLFSKFLSDRIGWLLCCCASACCAGLLCAVLWERFTEVPALITLRDLRADRSILRLSNIAFCQSARHVAHLFQRELVTDKEIRARLPAILSLVLRRKALKDSQVLLLERALALNNMTLPEALFKLMPTCGVIIRNCRWLSMTLPCSEIFRKEMTQWGVCCVMRPNQIELSSTLMSQTSMLRRLHVSLQFSNDTEAYGCELFTRYPGEEWVEPMTLTPGFNYFGSLISTSIEDSNVESLVNNRCIYRDRYTKSGCKIKCVEKYCGCSDPLQTNDFDLTPSLPTCSAANLNCLRTFKYDNLSCNCLPSCKKVTTDLAWEFSPINAFEYTYDNIYAGLNATLAIVVHLQVRLANSKKFIVNATETWITLLSSLGGVFNMFLGVGLFSALELIFLVFVKLPIALRKSAEMAAPRRNNH